MPSRDENGTARIFGVSLDRWVGLIQTLGIPTLFMLFVMYLAWVHVPPVVQGHIRLLERTGDTLESMDATLKQSNAILEDVNQVEKETRSFMQKVIADHETQCKKLDVVIEQTKPKPPATQ